MGHSSTRSRRSGRSRVRNPLQLWSSRPDYVSEPEKPIHLRITEIDEQFQITNWQHTKTFAVRRIVSSYRMEGREYLEVEAYQPKDIADPAADPLIIVARDDSEPF